MLKIAGAGFEPASSLAENRSYEHRELDLTTLTCDEKAEIGFEPMTFWL